MTPLTILLAIGLALSLIAACTTKWVSELIAPKENGFLAIPRTIASMGWFTFGPFIAIIFALIFGLLLALAA